MWTCTGSAKAKRGKGNSEREVAYDFRRVAAMSVAQFTLNAILFNKVGTKINNLAMDMMA